MQITSKVVHSDKVEVPKDNCKLKLFKGTTSGDVYVELPDGKHMRLSCRHPDWVGRVYDRYRDDSVKLLPFVGSVTITAER